MTAAPQTALRAPACTRCAAWPRTSGRCATGTRRLAPPWRWCSSTPGCTPCSSTAWRTACGGRSGGSSPGCSARSAGGSPASRSTPAPPSGAASSWTTAWGSSSARPPRSATT